MSRWLLAVSDDLDDCHAAAPAARLRALLLGHMLLNALLALGY